MNNKSIILYSSILCFLYIYGKLFIHVVKFKEELDITLNCMQIDTFKLFIISVCIRIPVISVIITLIYFLVISFTLYYSIWALVLILTIVLLRMMFELIDV